MRTPPAEPPSPPPNHREPGLHYSFAPFLERGCIRDRHGAIHGCRRSRVKTYAVLSRTNGKPCPTASLDPSFLLINLSEATSRPSAPQAHSVQLVAGLVARERKPY